MDPLTRDYPILTPYQFASNTPIWAIDLDGLEAFYVHGTWSNSSTFPALTISTINNITSNTTGPEFNWSGDNTNEARQQAAQDLANHIMQNRDPSQPLTIVGHSHGGNVSILAANILQENGYQVDNIITINTPVREYQLDNGAAKKHINVYHNWDPVQGFGGDAINNPLFEGEVLGSGEMGLAGRRFDGATNIDVPHYLLEVVLGNFHESHKQIHKWQEQLDSFINPKPPLLLHPAPQDNTRVAPKYVPQD